MKLRRIDSELVRRGLAKSRGAAAQMIEDGRVKLDGEVVLKPARQMDPAQEIVVEESIRSTSPEVHTSLPARSMLLETRRL